MSSSRFRMISLARLHRVFAGLFIAAYLSAIGSYLLLHVQGDPAGGPFAYFWTWDMFADYSTESVRRVVVGQTGEGKYVRLLAGPRHRFRSGVHGDVARIDFELREASLRAAVETAVAESRQTSRGDPVVRVFLFEQYWPVRFNLPGELYVSVYGERNPGRRYWRVLDEAEVTSDGRVQWISPP